MGAPSQTPQADELAAALAEAQARLGNMDARKAAEAQTANKARFQGPRVPGFNPLDELMRRNYEAAGNEAIANQHASDQFAANQDMGARQLAGTMPLPAQQPAAPQPEPPVSGLMKRLQQRALALLLDQRG